MEFINHAINWCKGEIFEARMIFFFGLLVTIVALAFWKFGTTTYAKSIFIPLLVVGLLFVIFGTTIQIINKKRISTFTEAWQEDQVAFVKSEKERTESFMKVYPILFYSFSTIIVAGVICFLFWGSPTGRSIGLAFILFGFTATFLDHFSQERGQGYLEQIEEALEEEVSN